MYYLFYNRCNDFWNCWCFCRSYIATENTFPVQLNGKDVAVDGYNIDGSTYFKLRDVANVVGGFDVDFFNNTIQLSKDNYKYDNKANKIDYSKYQGTYAVLNGSSKYIMIYVMF